MSLFITYNHIEFSVSNDFSFLSIVIFLELFLSSSVKYLYNKHRDSRSSNSSKNVLDTLTSLMNLYVFSWNLFSKKYMIIIVFLCMRQWCIASHQTKTWIFLHPPFVHSFIFKSNKFASDNIKMPKGLFKKKYASFLSWLCEYTTKSLGVHGFEPIIKYQ